MVNFLEPLIVCQRKFIGDDYLKIIQNFVCSSKQTTVLFEDQLMRTSINPMGP